MELLELLRAAAEEEWELEGRALPLGEVVRPLRSVQPLGVLVKAQRQVAQVQLQALQPWALEVGPLASEAGLVHRALSRG